MHILVKIPQFLKFISVSLISLSRWCSWAALGKRNLQFPRLFVGEGSGGVSRVFTSLPIPFLIFLSPLAPPPCFATTKWGTSPCPCSYSTDHVDIPSNRGKPNHWIHQKQGKHLYLYLKKLALVVSPCSRDSGIS